MLRDKCCCQVCTAKQPAQWTTKSQVNRDGAGAPFSLAGYEWVQFHTRFCLSFDVSLFVLVREGEPGNEATL